MAKTVRIAYTNLVQAAASVLVPSSEETSLPRAALTRPKTSDRWRTKTGWTVVLNENDRIDFNQGGVKQAVIAAGTYATGALAAAAIQTAMTAADGGATWTVTYSAVTFKFTIASNLAFTLLFETGGGVVAGQSAHIDLGYADGDTASATSHVAGSVAYQSRHSINVDLGSAQAFAAVIVRGHNLSTAGTVRFDADTTTLIGAPLTTPFADPPDVVAFPVGTDPRIVFFASQTKRYLRLVIQDVQNSVGYNEVGIFFVGPYAQPTILESINFVEYYEPLSEIIYAIGGSHDQVRRDRRLVYTLNWEDIEQANIDIFKALNLAMPMGASFFLSLNAVDAPTTSTVYGFFRNGLSIPMRSGPYSNVGPLEFAEALG
jgi:hypothetical protein